MEKFIRTLKYLHTIKHGDLTNLPTVIPKGYGTIQLYAAIFEGLLNGHSIIVAVGSRLVMFSPKGMELNIAVPGVEGVVNQLLRALLADGNFHYFENMITEDDVMVIRWNGESPSDDLRVRALATRAKKLDTACSSDDIREADQEAIKVLSEVL